LCPGGAFAVLILAKVHILSLKIEIYMLLVHITIFKVIYCCPYNRSNRSAVKARKGSEPETSLCYFFLLCTLSKIIASNISTVNMMPHLSLNSLNKKQVVCQNEIGFDEHAYHRYCLNLKGMLKLEQVFTLQVKRR